MAVHELDDQELLVLRALRAAPDRGLGELADGRAAADELRSSAQPPPPEAGQPARRGGAGRGSRGRYRLSERGRRVLAEHALDGIL